jgi:aspartate oxidase
VSEDALIQQVYGDLQRQVELMLEYRLREALAPMLTRAADSIVRDARNELASTLRDVVARAVAQELSRHRPR